ncbi:uncharacterized protein LOC106467059 [Limulus polyphemus]|uniref:Uncharacterized protein LOC106467059 n=1 Tax=Limulus polyphemus TaxID=6850 RepID=A0ABM1T4S3_LIMPO|nr:uncharacterized protein LOC106467059 [Limulus polyphemus]
MAPKGFWRRPLTLMYNHNYNYGTGLYSSALDDIDKRYGNSLSRIPLDGGPIMELGLNLPMDPATKSLSTFGNFDAGYSTYPLKFHSLVPELDPHTIKQTRSFGELDDFRIKYKTEWDPPSSFLYSPYRSSSYVGEITPSKIRRRRQAKKRQELIELEKQLVDNLSSQMFYGSMPPMKSYEFLERCQEVQTQIEQLLYHFSEAESRLQSDAKWTKNKLQMEIAELGMMLDEEMRVNKESQKVFTKQGYRLSETTTHLLPIKSTVAIDLITF